VILHRDCFFSFEIFSLKEIWLDNYMGIKFFFSDSVDFTIEF